MRILILSPYSNPVTGGIPQFVDNLRRRLESRGQEVRVVSMSGDPEPGVDVLLGKGPALWRRILRGMREFRPDVVHVNGHWELLVPAIVRKFESPQTRVVFTFHTTTLTSGLRRRLFSALLNRCDAVTAVSADTLARMARRYRVRVPIAKTPPGADPPSARSESELHFRERHRIPSHVPVLAAISPLVYPRKVAGLVDLIRAFPRILESHPEAHLVIAGDGILRPQVDRLVQELGLEERVHLVGALTDPGPMLRTATVFCHISYQDELPLVILEAIAHGRAIVCSPVGGIPEAVRDNEEALFVEGGPEQIAEKVVSVLSDAALGERLAARALERFRSEYTWDHSIQKIAAVYRLPGPKRVHVTLDIEPDYLGKEDSFRGVTEALPRILELLEKHEVPASAFVTADIALRFPELVERLRTAGLEIGSHGRSHGDPSFASLSPKDQAALLAESLEPLRACGIEPIGFRAPNFRINAGTIRALVSAAWRVDSSVVPGRRVRPTRDSPRIDFRGAPLSPYRPDPMNPVRIGGGPILEVPVSANPDLPGSPLGLGYLNAVGPAEFLRMIETYPAEDVTFLIHPWEALDYGPGAVRPAWMRRGCRSELSGLDAFLHAIHRDHRPIRMSDLLRSPLEPNEKWWVAGGWPAGSRRPRIFLVTHVYRPIIGGVTTYVDGLADALRAGGFDVTVIGYPSLLVRHEAAHPRFWRRKLLHGAFIGLAFLRILAARLGNRRVVVHSHGANFCLVVSYLAKLVGCVGLHTFHSPLHHRSMLLEWLGPRLDALLYVAVQTRALYESTNAIHHTRVAIVPGGIPLARIPAAAPEQARRAARGRLGVDPYPFVVGYVGRVVPEKGVDLAIRALARMRESGTSAALLIVGPTDGSRSGREYLSSVRAQIDEARLSDYVRILGPVNRADLEEVYVAADCLVVPSRWEEPAPMVVIEALARGIPVVAASVGGLRTRVSEGVTGFLFPAGAFDALAEQLTTLAKQGALRERLGHQARQWAERHGDVRNLAEFHSQVYSVLSWESGLS